MLEVHVPPHAPTKQPLSCGGDNDNLQRNVSKSLARITGSGSNARNDCCLFLTRCTVRGGGGGTRTGGGDDNVTASLCAPSTFAFSYRCQETQGDFGLWTHSCIVFRITAGVHTTKVLIKKTSFYGSF